jgi:hypothetical protein
MNEELDIDPPAVEEATVAHPHFRFWMTRCMAVVMAAFVGSGAARAVERSGTRSQFSPFGMAETMLRIEASAQRHGMQVFALVDRSNGANAPEWEFAQVLVLASTEGGTLVTMDHPGATPAVPMSLIVRAHSDGSTEVLIGQAADPAALPGLPLQLRHTLDHLPEVVADALR